MRILLVVASLALVPLVALLVYEVISDRNEEREEDE